MSIEPFSIQLEYDTGVVFEVVGEFEAGEPMTWQGFHFEPGHAPTVGIESVCVVGTQANLLDALSESCCDWIRAQVCEQMGETA